MGVFVAVGVEVGVNVEVKVGVGPVGVGVTEVFPIQIPWKTKRSHLSMTRLPSRSARGA